MQEKAKVFKVITVTVIVFIVFLTAALIINLVKVAKASSRERELNTRLAAKIAQYEETAETIEYKQSEESITRIARQELNMKGEGETVFTGKKEK